MLTIRERDHLIEQVCLIHTSDQAHVATLHLRRKRFSSNFLRACYSVSEHFETAEITDRRFSTFFAATAWLLFNTDFICTWPAIPLIRFEPKTLFSLHAQAHPSAHVQHAR